MAFPMQPIILDEQGTARFQENKIVRFLLDAGPFDMNKLACLPGISREEREQFAQLIGYSVDGFGELSYASDEVVAQADRIAGDLYEAESNKNPT